jgi:hypothetical protein
MFTSSSSSLSNLIQSGCSSLGQINSRREELFAWGKASMAVLRRLGNESITLLF